MKIIVFGGSGFIGTNFIKLFGAEENAYYSRHRSKELDDFGAKWIEGNILDEAKVMEAVGGYDMVVVAARSNDEKDETHFDVQVNGMKNIVKGIKKIDKEQKLVYFSHINLEKGKTEYFRVKRVAEGNVQLIKNHLIVRPSFVFGTGDHITSRIVKLAGEGFSKFPQEGNLSPVHIADLINVIKNSLETKGAINVSGRKKLSFLDAINTARSAMGHHPAKPAGRLSRKSSIRKISERGVFSPEEIGMFLLDYYRDNTMLLERYVKEPASYVPFLENAAKGGN
ncbi:MAG: hypothetical protein B2I17_00205 [Thermoplasmatales archaeon B_DKE]|nr:MAG: hypothetical protein B2I17_00205 [Thermoplasmatales archaeon B_DKE]QRF74658.1 Putative NADH-flavin reductase [Thermoplasmatales archaeon]